ncbi:MAG: 7-carboxy-7-deazaguanine synthase QueE [Methanobacteriota archaeon]
MKIIEIFASIQGEGRFIGEPQAFVRMAGCNMRCSWCDTPESWGEGRQMSVEDIVGELEGKQIKTVCITGGEPLLQVDELRKLIQALKEKEYKIILETNGSIYDEEVFSSVDSVALDLKPPSSKEESDESIMGKLKASDYVKVVVADDTDLAYAKKIIDKASVEVYLQPDKLEKINWLIEKALEAKLGGRVLPQLHKIIGVK